MIDTHCHLTYPGLGERVERVIADAQAAGVDRMICVGTTPDDVARAATLAERFESVFFTAGIHPHHAATAPDTDALIPFLTHRRCVAIGEMGLDTHFPEPSPDLQQHLFTKQLDLMARFPHLPGVIHNRKATDDTIAMIRAANIPGHRLVFHCFTGSIAEVEAILDLGAMISFTGIVTFKSAADVAAASDRVPLDRLMIETDAPYLAPEPHRKVKPNEPRYVTHVAHYLAARRDMTTKDFTTQTDTNAERFFRLDQAT